MKKLLSLFFVLSLLSSFALAGPPAAVANGASISPQGIQQSTSGGPLGAGAITVPLASIDTAGVITIGGSVGGLVAGGYSWLKGVDGVQYQVPSGKSLYVTDVWVSGASANTQASIGYSTAALSVDGQGSGPGGTTKWLFTSSATVGNFPFYASPTAYQWVHYAMVTSQGIPAGSYMFFQNQNTSTYIVFLSGIVK